MEPLADPSTKRYQRHRAPEEWGTVRRVSFLQLHGVAPRPCHNPDSRATKNPVAQKGRGSWPAVPPSLAHAHAAGPLDRVRAHTRAGITGGGPGSAYRQKLAAQRAAREGLRLVSGYPVAAIRGSLEAIGRTVLFPSMPCRQHTIGPLIRASARSSSQVGFLYVEFA